MSWWVGYARAGHEFEVQQAVQETGASAWVARKLEPKRVPTKRRPVAVVAPYLANYVFIDCTDEQWHEIVGTKWLAHTMMPLSEGMAARYLRPFMQQVDDAFNDRAARHEAGERLEAFVPGESLLITAGPLQDFMATFERVVQGANDMEDRLRAHVSIFGRVTPVLLDPLDVTRTAAE